MLSCGGCGLASNVYYKVPELGRVRDVTVHHLQPTISLCEAGVGQTMLDDTVVMVTKHLLDTALTFAHVEFVGVIGETEGVGLDAMVTG